MIKALLEKEWHENRFLLLGVVSLTVVWFLWIRRYAFSYLDALIFDLSFYDLLSPLFLIIPAILGAGLMSSEYSSKTIAFLLALPLKRSRVWLTKFLMGLSELLLVLAIIISLALPICSLKSYFNPVYFWLMVSWCFLTYSLTFFFSTLFDRAIISFFTGIIATFVLFFAIALLLGLLRLIFRAPRNISMWEMAISGLIVGAAFAVASLIVFKRRKV